MKSFKKLCCVFMALATILTSTVTVYAEEPTDFEETDSPMIENTTDSTQLPGYMVENPEVHGTVDSSEATEITSMFSDDAWGRFSSDLDRILNFEPASDEETGALLSKVDNFVSSGGVEAYLQNNNLLLGSEIGLCNNNPDKVRVLGENSNAQGWIYVVDKDAVCVIVKDTEGQGIPKPLVTISYLDENNIRKTMSIVGTDGATPGLAVFSGLPETFNGILDVQVAGYRAVTVLDKEMAAGGHYTFVLEEAETNDLYIRGLDLSGKDMMFEETNLVLVDQDTGDLSFKVIISKTGNTQFPDSIELYSQTRDTTILKVDKTSAYAYDSNTRVYTADRRWAEQNAGLLVDQDVVAVRYGGKEDVIEHLTVENAILTPGLAESMLPFTSRPMPGNISDRMGGTGWINLTAQILQVPVTVGRFPDGNFIILASYDITQLDKNTQYKYSSLFEKSWNPKTFAACKNPLEVFQKSFWANAEKVKGGQEKLNSPTKVKCLTNKYYDFSMSFSLFLASNYNKDTSDFYGTGGIIFTGSLNGGVTEYFLFVVGPVAIPVYIGFEAGITVNTALSLNFGLKEPPEGEGAMEKWKYAAGGGVDVNSRIEVVANFSVYGGVGVKGVLGAAAVGYFTVDVATVLGKGTGSVFTAEPHSLIDLLYGLRIDYYLLFIRGSIKLSCLNGAKRVFDSRGEKDKLTEADEYEYTFSELSLETCADRLVPLLTEDTENTDRAFKIVNDSEDLTARPSTVNVDLNTYPDNQAQFAATKNHTALFRIVSDGERTFIVYQMQDKETGKLEDTVYMVEMPEDETRSITEFVAVPNKTDEAAEYCDNVYIGAIMADNTLSDTDARARSTEVVAMIVNIAERKTTYSQIVSNPANSGKYLYSAPKPVGREDYLSVAYAETTIAETIENPAQLLQAISSSTYNEISYRSPDDPTQREYCYITQKSNVYSTGAIAPNEPSFWVIDPIKSTDKTLVLIGYGSNGYSSENDARCRVNVDISENPAVDFDYEPLITNWQYINGVNYFISGDSVHYITKFSVSSDGSSYRWVTDKVRNGSGVISVENRYTMITNNNRSAIYIIGVIEDYNSNMETGASSKAANRMQIYSITMEEGAVNDGGKIMVSKLHGPIEIKFAYSEPIMNFAATYNPDSCRSKGLSLVYSTPVEPKNTVNTNALRNSASVMAENDDDEPEYAEATDTAAIRMWQQNAGKGMLVTEIQIPDYLVTEGDAYIKVNVTTKNYGYAVENKIMFRAYDEWGHKLVLTDRINDLDDDYYYTIPNLFTGDTRTDTIYIRPYDGWEMNKQHTINVQVTADYYYDGIMDDIVNFAIVQANNTSMTAHNTLIGGKHYVSVSIENNTLTHTEMPMVQAVFDYTDPEKEKTMKFSIPADELLHRYDTEDGVNTELTYYFDIDFDTLWEDGLKEGLRGAYFSLVDAEGNQVSNEVIYVANPEEQFTDKIVGIKTDENGEPVVGAIIGLYVPGESEPIKTVETDENGEFRFANVKEGTYIVKEIEAPEGYVLSDEEITVEAEGDHKIYEVEIINKKISGSVSVTVTDENDPEKKLSGAVLKIYSGDELIATLKETEDGVYELPDLPYGEYTVKMETAPDKYEKSSDMTLTITNDGETVSVTMTEYR